MWSVDSASPVTKRNSLSVPAKNAQITCTSVKPNHRKHPTGRKTPLKLFMYAHIWLGETCSCQCPNWAKCVCKATSTHTIVNTKIITKVFCPLRSAGCYLPVPVFSKCLQKLWFSFEKTGKGSAREVFALGGSLDTSALQCSAGHCPKPASFTGTSSEKQVCPAFSRRWSSRVSHVKRYKVVWGVREDKTLFLGSCLNNIFCSKRLKISSCEKRKYTPSACSPKVCLEMTQKLWIWVCGKR